MNIRLIYAALLSLSVALFSVGCAGLAAKAGSSAKGPSIEASRVSALIDDGLTEAEKMQ